MEVQLSSSETRPSEPDPFLSDQLELLLMIKTDDTNGTPALRIPPELIGEIAQYLIDDLSALYSLSLASKILQDECQPLLYRFVTQDPFGGRGPPLRVLKKYPHLTRHIHTYRFQQVESFKPSRDWDLLRPGPALLAMRNLKELHIDGCSGVVPKDILIDCPFQVRSFSWTSPLPALTLKRFLEFLATQRDIRRLASCVTLPDTFGVPLALPACEALEHLEGDRGSIETFLPARKVTSLAWIPSWGDPTNDIQHLSKEFGGLQKLSFHTVFGLKHIVGFDIVAPYLKKLWYLELSTFSFELLDHIHLLPNLVQLRLSRGFKHLRNQPDERWTIFERCHLLSFLDITLEDMPTFANENEFNFERYDRNGGLRTYYRPQTMRSL